MITSLINSVKEVLGLGVEASYLTLIHMTSRTLLIYFLGIVILRLHKQFMGTPTVFSFILSIILGSVLANGITGSVPFMPVIGVFLITMLVNSALAILVYCFPTIEKIVQGSRVLLVRDGKIQWANMRKNFINEDELIEALHMQGQLSDIAQVKLAYFEANGEISIIPYRLHEKEKAE